MWWPLDYLWPLHNLVSNLHGGHKWHWQAFLSDVNVIVIGAGIVGLASAFYLVQAGARVTLVDRDPEGDKASLGNAGGIAVTEVIPASVPEVAWRVFGWMLDPMGPLAVRPSHAPKLIPWLARFARSGSPKEIERISAALAAINSRVYEDLAPILSAVGLSHELHRKGALWLYETEEGFRRDAAEWACKRSLGVEALEITAPEARNMEPALGPRTQRAVFTPQWSHVSDPRNIVDAVRHWLMQRGVTLQKGEVVDIASRAFDSVCISFAEGMRLTAQKVVIAAGAWSASLVKRMGDRVLLESERGYNTTLPRPGVVVHRELIFAERKFVATPLSCGLRVGGAAEFGGLEAPPQYRRSQVLLDLASLYLPELQSTGGTYWAGHRPTTPDSLPVIGRSRRHDSVLYAFGHGHLGLTQAATTGRLISELAFRRKPSLDLAPYGIERYC